MWFETRLNIEYVKIPKMTRHKDLEQMTDSMNYILKLGLPSNSGVEDYNEKDYDTLPINPGVNNYN